MVSSTRTLVAALVTLLLFSPAKASELANDDFKKIRVLLDKPDDQIDLTNAKLAIDHFIDPSINSEKSKAQLNGMVDDVQAMLPPNADSLMKLEVLVQYLYQGGVWNNNLPFRYDLDDPFGNHLTNKLLPTSPLGREIACQCQFYLFSWARNSD
jgi:hypothetical protein